MHIRQLGIRELSISVTWYNKEKSILCMHFDDCWAWDAFDTAQAEIYRLADDAPGPVGLVILMPERLVPPRNLLSGMQYRLPQVHPNIVLRVVVTRNDFIGLLFHLFMTMNPHFAERFRLVPTPATAVAMIDEQLARAGR